MRAKWAKKALFKVTFVHVDNRNYLGTINDLPLS